MKKKRIISIAVVAAIVAVTILKLASNKQTLNQRAELAIQQQIYAEIPVKTHSVKKESVHRNFKQSGTFAPLQDLKLTAQSQGQIVNLYVKKSQFVSKGTLLASIDNSGLTSQLATAKASLEKAQQDAQRMKNALASGGVTQQQVENVDLQVSNAQTVVMQLEQQSANYQITAPVSGVVNDIYAEAGSFVSPGTPIIQLVDITKVILNIGVNQEMIPNWKMGQKVKVMTEVYPGSVFEGRVETINVQADASQKIDIGISVENNLDKPIFAGMFGRVELSDEKQKEEKTSMLIPRAAIVGSIQDAKVYLVNANNTVALRSITTGRTFDNNVEVLSGLTELEQIVTAGQINLEEGKKVIIKN